MDKGDKAILTLTNSIGLMSYMALYDVFGFDVAKIKRFYNRIMVVKLAWNDGEFSTEAMLEYCASKKYDVVGFTKAIPKQKKIMLCGKNYDKEALRLLEHGFLINVIMGCIVLTEEFNFNCEQIEKYLAKVGYYVDSFTKRQPKTKKFYMDDNMIISIFKDELKLDLVTGAENVN